MRSTNKTLINNVVLIIIISVLIMPLSSNALNKGTAEEEPPITGIVRENNLSLGYLTLYLQAGAGSASEVLDHETSIQSFTYMYGITVTRDGRNTGIESVKPGDKVFLSLDKDGYIQKLSAKSYYQPVYGTIHYKGSDGIVLKNDEGIYAFYPVNEHTPVFRNNYPAMFSDLIPGSRIRILVQSELDNIDIAAVELEKRERSVTGIYRGKVEYFDPFVDTLAFSGVQEFVNGRWEYTPFMGIQSFKFSQEYKERPYRKIAYTAYFVTEQGRDGTQRIIDASYRSASLYESNFEDNILNISNGWLNLENNSNRIKLDENTIVIKDGKLTDISALVTLDPVKISAERTYQGINQANVVVCDTIGNDGILIYRGRIKEIEPQRSITVESFAVLNGITWNFTNAPKTFDINVTQTRLIDDNGIAAIRDLDSDYIGRTVYIAAKGTQIQLISTAPYAESPVSGRVTGILGATLDSSGQYITIPAGFSLSEVMIYDMKDHKWVRGSNLDVTAPVNAIVVKRGQIGDLTLLKPGDEIKVIRHSQSLTGIIIISD